MRKMSWNGRLLGIASAATLLICLACGASGQNLPTTQPGHYPKPTLDQAIKLPPISLKTTGLQPQEAFDMLSKATNTIIMPGPADRPNIDKTIWQIGSFGNIDFDVEGANFWEAALRLTESARVVPSVTHRAIQLNSITSLNSIKTPIAAYNTPTLQAGLYGSISGPRATNASLVLDLLVDPRLAIFSVKGPVVLQTAQDPEGNPVKVTIGATQYPGDNSPNIGANPFGSQSITSRLSVIRGARMEVLSGYLLATIATASKPLEFALDNGKVTDETPREIGDWRITASQSLVGRPPAGFSGGPTHALNFTVERLKDSAAEFPAKVESLISFVGAQPNASFSKTGDGKTQQWKVFLNLNGPRSLPLSKLILDVPTEVKEVALPFKFERVTAPATLP